MLEPTLPFSEDNAILGVLSGCQGTTTGQRFPITGSSFLIGRRRDSCDLVIKDRRISGVHARIVADGPEFVIIDENSSNGTYVNGKRVLKTRLRDGDRVRFNDQVFRFWTLDPDEANRSLLARKAVGLLVWLNKIWEKQPAWIVAAVLAISALVSLVINGDGDKLMQQTRTIVEAKPVVRRQMVTVFGSEQVAERNAGEKQNSRSPVAQVELSVRHAGKVARVFATPNTWVEGGDVLFELASAPHRRRVNALKESVRSLEVVSSLHSSPQAKALLRKSRAQLKRATMALGELAIVAPQSGRLARLRVDEGDWVKPGEVIGVLELFEDSNEAL